MVMNKYPKEQKERNCRQHAQIMKDKRDLYREQLRQKQQCPSLN
jgi:hypothetical protein